MLTANEINGMSIDERKAIPAQVISTLPVHVQKAIHPNVLNFFTDEQRQALKAENLTAVQLGALSPHSVRSLSVKQIKTICTAEHRVFPSTFILFLNKEQASAEFGEGYADVQETFARNLSAAEQSSLHAWDIIELPDNVRGKLKGSQFTTVQVEGLIASASDRHQREVAAQIDTARYVADYLEAADRISEKPSTYYLTDNQFRELRRDVVQGMQASTIRKLTADRIELIYPMLSNPQIGKLGMVIAYQLGTLGVTIDKSSWRTKPAMAAAWLGRSIARPKSGLT